MSALIILEAKAKSEEVSKLQSLLLALLPDTREQQGCLDIDLYVDTNDTDKLVLVERWETLKQYKKYRLWRIKSGVMEKLSSMFIGPPSTRILDMV